jgi:hypothetical protein
MFSIFLSATLPHPERFGGQDDEEEEEEETHRGNTGGEETFSLGFKLRRLSGKRKGSIRNQTKICLKMRANWFKSNYLAQDRFLLDLIIIFQSGGKQKRYQVIKSSPKEEINQGRC